MTLPRIKIVTLINEEEAEYETVTGYLTTEGYAMYLCDGTLYLTRVNRTQIAGLYVEAQGGIVILGTEIERGDIVIEEVYDKLRNMTAWDFVRINVLNMRLENDFELA